MVLAKAGIENDYHYRLGFDFDNHYRLSFLRMIIVIILVSRTYKNLYKRFMDNRKVYEVKVFLRIVALLRYRCVCFGMVLA